MRLHGLIVATAFLLPSTAMAIDVTPPGVISPTTSPTAERRTVPAPHSASTPAPAPTVTAVPAAAPLPAQTARRGQAYIHVGGAVSSIESSDVELVIIGDDSILFASDIDVEYDTGFSGKLGFGYRGANGLGFELLGEYGETEVDEIEGFAAVGDVDYYSAIASIYFSPSAGILEPKVGAGAGVMHVEWTDVQAGNVVFFDDDATGLALEGQAGLMFRVAPNFALGPTYRFRYVKDIPADDAVTTMHIAEFSMQIGF